MKNKSLKALFGKYAAIPIGLAGGMIASTWIDLNSGNNSQIKVWHVLALFGASLIIALVLGEYLEQKRKADFKHQFCSLIGEWELEKALVLGREIPQNLPPGVLFPLGEAVFNSAKYNDGKHTGEFTGNIEELMSNLPSDWQELIVTHRTRYFLLKSGRWPE